MRTKEEVNADVRRKGATTFIQLEVLLDIRELLEAVLIALNERK